MAQQQDFSIYQRGWEASLEFQSDRSKAFGRGWMEVPMLIIGMLIIMFAAFVFLASGTAVLDAIRLGALLVMGVGIVGFAWVHHKRENEVFARRQSEFEAKWYGKIPEGE